jgi:hypothetical protein
MPILVECRELFGRLLDRRRGYPRVSSTLRRMSSVRNRRLWYVFIRVIVVLSLLRWKLRILSVMARRGLVVRILIAGRVRGLLTLLVWCN